MVLFLFLYNFKAVLIFIQKKNANITISVFRASVLHESEKSPQKSPQKCSQLVFSINIKKLTEMDVNVIVRKFDLFLKRNIV